MALPGPNPHITAPVGLRKGQQSLDDCDAISMVAHIDKNEFVLPEPEPEFELLNQTRHRIYDTIAALNDDSFTNVIERLLKQYESAIREEFERAKDSPIKCRKLTRILISLTDIIYNMGTAMHLDAIFRQRMCHIVAYYISCELCAAQLPVEQDQFIIDRINFALKSYVEKGLDAKEQILKTYMAIPMLFNQANIMKDLYGRLFPLWPVGLFSVIIQAELPDKIYIQYILIFYYWQCLETNEVIQKKILEFANKFMRPSSSLALNPIYAKYLPKYSTRNVATSCILEHLKQYTSRMLREASKLDNRVERDWEMVLSSDDEDDDGQSLNLNMFAHTATVSATPSPPAFLQKIWHNARRLEPCKRASALFKSIDCALEIVDLSDSDDDVEMFSVDFNVPANVDATNDQTASLIASAEDDYVPITQIYPSNLRTYQRATSGAPAQALPPPPTTQYTVPRIVNSYSLDSHDSHHLVTTTAPHLVDQSVQTAETDAEQDPQQEEEVDEDDAISTCLHYSSTQLPATTTTTPTNELFYVAAHSNYYSTSSNSSEVVGSGPPSSQHDRQTVTHIATNSLSIRRPQKGMVSTSSASSTDWLESLKWQSCKEHQLAKDRMFVKSLQPTPTTSNPSSGTPTPHRPAPVRAAGRLILPTPPASTYSSGSPYPGPRRRCSTDTLSSVDLVNLESAVSSYKFRRHQFSKVDKQSVQFYNQLLSQQRKSVRQRRALQQEDLMFEAIQKRSQLRAINAQKRAEVERLEYNLNAIRNYTTEWPLVRLKHCKGPKLVMQQQAELAETKIKSRKPRRAKSHNWSRVRKRKKLAKEPDTTSLQSLNSSLQ